MMMIFPVPARSRRGGRSVSLGLDMGFGHGLARLFLALWSQLKWRPDRLPWLPRNALNYRVGRTAKKQVRGRGIGVLSCALPWVSRDQWLSSEGRLMEKQVSEYNRRVWIECSLPGCGEVLESLNKRVRDFQERRLADLFGRSGPDKSSYHAKRGSQMSGRLNGQV